MNVGDRAWVVRYSGNSAWMPEATVEKIYANGGFSIRTSKGALIRFTAAGREYGESGAWSRAYWKFFATEAEWLEERQRLLAQKQAVEARRELDRILPGQTLPREIEELRTIAFSKKDQLGEWLKKWRDK